MKNKTTNIIAGILLVFVFFICFFSILEDVLTFDETAHIAAGYSYLTQRDMRLNPEHPPLIKDTAAFPLLFLSPEFPKDSPNWTQEHPPMWWTQFDFANDFLYKSGNNPDKIMLFSRTAMILALLVLGWLIFHFARERFGNKAGLISLALFSLSPTFLAHGRLANTDIGAALGALVSIYFWLKFLKEPNKKTIILAGIAFGIALLLKFSLVLLIPVFIIITLIYAALKGMENKKFFTTILKYSCLAFLVGIIGFVFVVGPVYQYHINNYPHERQARDAEFLLSTFGNRPIASTVVFMSDKPILRPFAQYFTGLFMALQRTDTGNTTYFLGEISTSAWKAYFPFVYAVKEPIPFHLLTIISFAILLVLAIRKQVWQMPKQWMLKYFPEFAMIVFIAVYWITSINSNLNIGVRHLLPAFPFTFILVGGIISSALSRKTLIILLVPLFAFQAYSVLSVYPHFIAYFNEFIGPENGYKYVVDSNLDWGQDLKRLKKWLDEQNINFVHIDYFGGGNLDYYLGEGNYARWSKEMKPHDLPENSYLVVSANQMQGGRGTPVKGFKEPTDYYMWLDRYEPVKIIGYSIFVYYKPGENEKDEAQNPRVE